MSVKFCNYHGSVDTTDTKCPQCGVLLNNEPKATEEEHTLVCKHCGTTHQMRSDVLPKFCTLCGAKFAKKVVDKGPRVEEFGKDVEEVVIGKMLADVKIVPSDKKTVVVTVTGDEEIKQGMQMVCELGKLVLKAQLPFDDSAGGNSIFLGNTGWSSGSISISYGGGNQTAGLLMIDGKVVDMSRKIAVVVEVPFGTDIRVTKLMGDCVVGDVGGNLVVKAEGAMTVSVGKVSAAQVELSGSGTVEIVEIKGGDVHLKVRGSGRILVGNVSVGKSKVDVSGSGKVSLAGLTNTFKADVSGSGNVRFDGVAEEADLDVSGSGRIYLKECRTCPSRDISGAGSIVVENWQEKFKKRKLL